MPDNNEHINYDHCMHKTYDTTDSNNNKHNVIENTISKHLIPINKLMLSLQLHYNNNNTIWFNANMIGSRFTVYDRLMKNQYDWQIRCNVPQIY